MEMPLTRRELIKASLAAGAAVALSAAVSACQKAVTSSVVPLTFDDSDEFYKQLYVALNSGNEVHIAFGGEAKIGSDSRLIGILAKTTNAQDLWKQIQQQDTEKGRDALRTAFTPELLAHQVVSNDLSKASNNVVEPGTIVLVAVIALVVSITTAAVADTMLKVPVVGDLQLEFDPPAFHLSLRPVDPHAAS